MKLSLSLVVLGLMAMVSLGQSAPGPAVAPPVSGPGPAGNAHPDAGLVSDAAPMENPFVRPGAGRAPQEATPAQVKAFADQLDLEPLRSAAVFHRGRVKIVDTLARETVRSLTGRGAYREPVSRVDLSAGNVSYDPVFTWLELVIQPERFVDAPLLHVDYLPLRRALLLHAFPDNESEREAWSKMTRVSPRMLAMHGGEVASRYATELPYAKAQRRLDGAEALFLNGGANLLLIAPASESDEWHHISEWPAESPPRQATARLGDAFARLDAAEANAAIAELAAALAAVNAEQYPGARRGLELAYNRSNAFEWGYWAYFFALIALVLAFGTGRRWLTVSGAGLLLVGLALHGAGFVARSMIAERFAIQNQFESMTGVSLFAAIVGVALMAFRKQPLFGAAAAGCGFLALIAATQTGIPGKVIEREAAILNTSVLLKYHVTTVLTSYGLITLGFIASLFYLGTHYLAALRARGGAQVALAGGGAVVAGESEGPTKARVLGDLDTAQIVVLQLAFWTLGVGILLGAWWADHSWGRWWAWDPKETWALITWIIYLIVIHVRVGAGQRKGLVTAWLSVIGFIVMLWTYFGVNLLLPGLHAYA